MPAIRALAGVLYAGEPSLPRVMRGLEAQVDVELRTVLFGHHPFDEAHRRLYGAFDERRDEHDVLVKVDADMEIVEPRLLFALGTLFRTHPELDMVVLGVDDWLSGERIIGMNAWRGGMRWRAAPSPLFADLPRTDVRSRLKVMDAPRPLVLHATEPSAAQSRRYGAQRGLKVLDTLKQSRLERMQGFVRFVAANPEPARLLAVAGVEAALTDRDLAGRCLYGDEQFAPEDADRLERRAADPDLCVRTLEHLALLEGRVTKEGSGKDREVGDRPRAGWRDALARRMRPARPVDTARLRGEFVGLLG